MRKLKVSLILTILSFFITNIKICRAQAISPADGDSLNYTQVLFEIPDFTGAKKYRFIFLNDSNTILKDTVHFSNYLVVHDLFSFGNTYKWFCQYEDDKGILLHRSGTNSFRIKALSLNNKSFFKKGSRLNLPDKKGVVFLDGNASAINSSGEVVWFLPGKGSGIRDLKLKPDGTVQYLSEGLINTSLDGTKNISIPGFERYKYHHDAVGIDTKNYLVCGFLPPSAKQEAIELGGPFVSSGGSEDESSLAILEINAAGDLLWYFDVVAECKKQLGIDLKKDKHNKRLGHMNGLAVNDSGTVIYASFKNFSNVFEIRRTDKTIRRIYGNVNFNPKDSTSISNLFAAQHCPVILSNKNLMVFNNNTGAKSSSIIELNKKGEPVWEYFFSMHDSLTNHTNHMGSVTELSNGNYLVCAGNHNNRVFTVSRKKKLTGELVLFRPDSSQMANYRVSYSPTLYPSVFALRYNKSNKVVTQSAQAVIEFIIDNGGTANDSYNIRIMNESGKVLKSAYCSINKHQQNKNTISFRNSSSDKGFIVEVESVLSSRKKILRFTL